MIKENQRVLNNLNVLSDALWIFISMPAAYWVRFYLLHGERSLPFQSYLLLDAAIVPLCLFTFAAFGLYESFRRKRLYKELSLLFWACVLDLIIIMMFLFLAKEVHVSRGTLYLFFILSTGGLGCKRVFLRQSLRRIREQGYNQKHVILIGDSAMARRYYKSIRTDRELGYTLIGYVSNKSNWRHGPQHLGVYRDLFQILDHYRPDEAVAGIPIEEADLTPSVIAACEKSGTKLSLIPLYAEYMPSHPQFDEVDGIPLLNIRRIPLDSWVNAFLKRVMDIIGSLVLIVLTSPIMLAAAIGVKLSSPGPIIFRQERIGRNKKPFYMYKFRSMRLNCQQDTGWSTDQDGRKTKFGAFIRKCSIDELPQLFNVLKGDMSLVGPRPEVPFYVEQFKEEIPLYMVKHQVRPGMTGWAQVNGLRGDTSIRERIEHDIYYIEHWSVGFDIKILFLTLLHFMNSEKLN